MIASPGVWQRHAVCAIAAVVWRPAVLNKLNNGILTILDAKTGTYGARIGPHAGNQQPLCVARGSRRPCLFRQRDGTTLVMKHGKTLDVLATKTSWTIPSMPRRRSSRQATLSPRIEERVLHRNRGTTRHAVTRGICHRITASSRRPPAGLPSRARVASAGQYHADPVAAQFPRTEPDRKSLALPAGGTTTGPIELTPTTTNSSTSLNRLGSITASTPNSSSPSGPAPYLNAGR